MKVNLYGTALVLEGFGQVIARVSSSVMISSRSGHRPLAFSSTPNRALTMTPVDDLLLLPMLRLDLVTDLLRAYQLFKRGNSLRVMAEAGHQGGARCKAKCHQARGFTPLFRRCAVSKGWRCGSCAKHYEIAACRLRNCFRIDGGI